MAADAAQQHGEHQVGRDADERFLFPDEPLRQFRVLQHRLQKVFLVADQADDMVVIRRRVATVSTTNFKSDSVRRIFA